MDEFAWEARRTTQSPSDGQQRPTDVGVVGLVSKRRGTAPNGGLLRKPIMTLNRSTVSDDHDWCVSCGSRVRRTDMTCQEVAEFLMEYLDGRLSEPERRCFEEHLGECPECVAYLETYQETIRLGK